MLLWSPKLNMSDLMLHRYINYIVTSVLFIFDLEVKIWDKACFSLFFGAKNVGFILVNLMWANFSFNPLHFIIQYIIHWPRNTENKAVKSHQRPLNLNLTVELKSFFWP